MVSRAALTALLLASPAAAFETFEPSKWPETQQSFRIHESNGGAVLSGVATRGTPNTQSNELRLVNPNSVNTLEADFTLLEFRAPGGVTNEVRASIDGFFYKEGSGGNIRATFGIGADGSGNPKTLYYVLRCSDASCGSSTFLVGPVLGTPVQLFQTNKLKLQYDGTTFTFQVNNAAAAMFTPSDPVGSRTTTDFPAKMLRTRLDLVNSDPNAVAAVTALFENVRANGGMYDDFNTKTLPRVQILPGSGTFSTKQAFDGVLMIETAGEAVSSVKLTANGADITGLLSGPGVVQGTPAGGGKTYRVPGLLVGSALTPNAPVVIGAEIVTAGGQKASGFALWNAITVGE